MDKIRLGVIGPGIIWERVHKNELKRFENKFDIAAFCGRSDKSKNKAEKEYPGVPFYRDYKEMVREPFIDAVIVMTPILMNPVVAGEALDAGKDVFVEKPMAANVSNAAELIKKEKDSGKHIYVLEQFVYKKYTDELLKIMDSGKLGEILVYERACHEYIGYDKENDLNYGNTDWRINARYPLGMLMDGGIHEIAMLAKIFGKPLTTFAYGARHREHSYGDYDYELITFEYEDNLMGAFSSSYYLDGSHNYLVIRGTKGLAYYEGGLEITIEENNGNKEIIKLKDENPYDLMWDDFASCLEKGLIPYYTSEKALRDLEILEAIGKSLKEGIKVQVRR
jgi:predicted dehydrogenase